MKTKRQKLADLMAEMPQYIIADVKKICDEYERRYKQSLSKSYVCRLYGTARERVQTSTVPHGLLKKIKELIFSVGSKKQLKRLINQVIV